MSNRTVHDPQLQARYLLEFLAIMVERAGGEVTLEGLAAEAGKGLQLMYELDAAADKVTLKAAVSFNGRKRRPRKPRPRRIK